MSKIKTVQVNLGVRSYGIHIGQGLLRSVPDFVPCDLQGQSLFVLTDENVSKSYAGMVCDSLKAADPKSVELLALPPGEQTKSFERLEQVLAWLLDHNVTRQSVLFAVGGGVIGDLGGFAASIALRGIPYVQIPTSLLAQVDSSVGGKTAIDVPQGKNLVGSFYQPEAVICDLDVLQTLPRKELLAGYAEIAKYGLIDDPEFFVWLEKDGKSLCDGDVDAQAKAVEVSCRKKAEIVAQDERESGVRALLNLGHTFGHALESALGYDGRILHGEAVAIGMVLAFRLSCRLGHCAEKDADRVEDHLTSVGLPTKVKMIASLLENTAEEIVNHMAHDKKVQKGIVAFILVQGIGKAYVDNNVDMGDVQAVIKQSMEGSV